MKSNTPNYTFLQSGEKAVDLTPQFTGLKAVVDLGTIQRLAKLLPTANFTEIKNELITQISGARNLEQMLQVISEELAFHTSVNIITEYKPEEVAPPQALH